MAVRAEHSDVILDTSGNAISGASIAVYQVGTTTAITETIYADATGATTLTNPLTADAAGRFQFYLTQPKRVDLYVSATGYTAYTLEDVDVGRTSQLTVYKVTNQTVNDSETLVADDELKFTIGASEVWAFVLYIGFISGTIPDIKFGWTYPSGATMGWGPFAGTAVAGLAQTDTHTQNGSGAAAACQYVGRVTSSTTAGTVNLTWAQNTANASNTIVYGGSWMLLYRVA